MKIEQENQGFLFTYSAAEQDEIKRIRQKYQPQEENKMEQLRRLDEQVTKKATVVSLILGVIGALVMGAGMSLVMTDFGNSIGLRETAGRIAGISVGVFGMVLAGFAYPMYNHIVKKERERIAPEILRLTDELMK